MTARQARDEGLERILATSGRRSRAKRAILVAAVVLAAAALAALLLGGFRGGGEAGGLQKYVTAKVVRGELRAAISATGTVEALNTVQVGAEVSGRIAALHADFNDAVEAGELLAEIDPEQADAAVAEAQAQVLAARAKVAEANAALLEARLDEERSKALAGKGLLSPKELEAAVSKAARAAASLESARASAALSSASYQSARTRRAKTEIRAPISGTVLSRAVEVGQTINAGMQTPVLFTIAEDLKRMRLSSKVDEADIGAVAVDQAATFTVDAYPDRTFPSQVRSVRNVPITDQSVVSYEVILSVDNGELLLKPGMTASVEIVTMKEGDALLVPNRALRFSPPKQGFGPPRGMPFLGGQKRGGGGAADPEKALERIGKLTAKQGIAWVVEGAALRPVVVEKVATDGTSTAVAGGGLAEGAVVAVDLAETPAEAP